MANKDTSYELEDVEIEDLGKIKSGVVLRHPHFGVGILGEIYAFSDSDQISLAIDFEIHGFHAIAPGYVRMEKVAESEEEYRKLNQSNQSWLKRIWNSKKDA